MGRGRLRPVAADRVEPRRERAARDARRRARSPSRAGDAQLSVSDTGPGIPPERRAACVRALLPLRQDRQGPSRRERARPRDRAAARDARWAATSASRASPAGTTFSVRLRPQAARCRRPRSRRPSARRARVAGRSTNAGRARPRRTSSSRCRRRSSRRSSSPARRCAPASAAARCRRDAFRRTRRPIGGSDGIGRPSSRSAAPDRCTRCRVRCTVKRSAWSMRPVDASPFQRARPGRIGSPAASADVHAGRPKRVRAQVPDRARAGGPAPALRVQRVELVELAGVAVDDQRVTVAVVEMTRRAFDRHAGRDRVRALVALVGVVERDLRLRRRLAVHDDVGDADPRAVLEARAEVGVHARRCADRRRSPLPSRPRPAACRPARSRRSTPGRPGSRRASEASRRAEPARPASDARAASSFTVAGVAPASRPRFA